LDFTGLRVYSVPIYDDMERRGGTGLRNRSTQFAMMVDVAGVVPGPVVVCVLEADVGGAGWPVVVAAVAGGA
jgi:hypothetical protein